MFGSAFVDPAYTGVVACRARRAGRRIPHARADARALTVRVPSKATGRPISDSRTEAPQRASPPSPPARRGGPVHVRGSCDGGERLPALLDEGFAVEAAGWKGEQVSPSSSRPETLAFYRAVAEWAAERDLLKLAFLRLDGRPFAFDFCIEDGGIHYLLKTGFDPVLRQVRSRDDPPLRDARHARSRSGLRSYEFLGADEPWKLRVDRDDARAHLFQAFAPTARGRVEWAAFAYGRPLVKRRLRWSADERREDQRLAAPSAGGLRPTPRSMRLPFPLGESGLPTFLAGAAWPLARGARPWSRARRRGTSHRPTIMDLRSKPSSGPVSRCRFYEGEDDLQPDVGGARIAALRSRSGALPHPLPRLPPGRPTLAGLVRRARPLARSRMRPRLGSRRATDCHSARSATFRSFASTRRSACPTEARCSAGCPPRRPMDRRRLRSGPLVRRHAAWLAGKSSLLSRLSQLRKDDAYDMNEDFGLGDPDSPPVHRPRVPPPTAGRSRDGGTAARELRASAWRARRFGARSFRPRSCGCLSLRLSAVRTDRKAELLERLARKGIAALDFWSIPHPALPTERFPTRDGAPARTSSRSRFIKSWPFVTSSAFRKTCSDTPGGKTVRKTRRTDRKPRRRERRMGRPRRTRPETSLRHGNGRRSGGVTSAAAATYLPRPATHATAGFSPSFRSTSQQRGL